MNKILQRIKGRIAIIVCLSMMLEITPMTVNAATIYDTTASLESISENIEIVSENEEVTSENEILAKDPEEEVSDEEVSDDVISYNTISTNDISPNTISDSESTLAQKRFWELLRNVENSRENLNIPQDELKKRDEIIGRPRPENSDINDEHSQSFTRASIASTSKKKSQVYSDAILENLRTDEAYLDFYRESIYAEGSDENELIGITARMILDTYISENEMNISSDMLTDTQKVKAAHDWICEHVYYDYYHTSTTSNQDAVEVLRSAALDPDYQTEGHEPRMLAVCEGFSNLMEAILREYDIPCVNVSGTSTSNTSFSDEEFWAKLTDHAWNHYYLEDDSQTGGRWYFIDTTWDTYNRTDKSTTILKYNKGDVHYTYYQLTAYPTDHLLIDPNWITGVPKAFEPQIDADGTCHIPSGVKYLECSAFSGVSGIKRVEMTNDVIVIESDCMNLQELESVDLSKELAAFGTFSIKSGVLKSITMDGKKECIGTHFLVSDNAVYGGDGTSEALIIAVGPDNNTKFKISDTVKYITFSSIQGSRIRHLVIPDSVISMESRAIQTMNLEKLDIGSGLEKVFSPVYMAASASWNLTEPNVWVKNAKKMQEINFSENNTKYSSVDGIVYNKDKTKLLYIPKCYQKEIAMIEETVTDTISGACDNETVIVAMPDGMTNAILSKYNNYFGGICASSGSTLEQYALSKNVPYYVMPYIVAENQDYYYMLNDISNQINVLTAGYHLYYRWIKSNTPSISDGNILSGENSSCYTPSTAVGGNYYLWLQASTTSDFSSDVVTSGRHGVHVTDSIKTYMENYRFSMKESQIDSEDDIEQYINDVLSSVKTEDGKTLTFEKVSYTPLVSATVDSYEAMQGTTGKYRFLVRIRLNGEIVDTTEELQVNTIPEEIHIDSVSHTYSQYYVEIDKPITLDGINFTLNFSDGTVKSIGADQAEIYGIVPCVLLNNVYLYGDAVKHAQESYISQKRYFRYPTETGYAYKAADTILKIEPSLAFKDISVIAGEGYTDTLEFSGIINSFQKSSGALPNGLTLKINDAKTGLVLSGIPLNGDDGDYYYTGYASVTANETTNFMGFSIELDYDNPTYTISYVLNGSVNNTQNPTGYQYGSGYISLKNPIMENSEFKEYVFAGWYTTESFTEASRVYSIDRTLKKNMTLYAKWRLPYSVKYNVLGGTLSENEPAYVGKSSGVVTLPVPTREGYKFRGWYTSYNTGTGAYSGNPYFTYDCSNNSQNLSFYAKWSKRCNIIYQLNANNGKNHPMNPSEFYTGDESFTLLPATLEGANQEGYEFGGWYLDASFTEHVTILDFSGDKDITLYAKWDAEPAIRHSITWNLNGGSCSANMPLTYHEATPPLTLPIPERENAKFGGWYRTKISYNEYKDPVTSLDFSTEDDDITLHAKWLLKHKIKYEWMSMGENAGDNPSFFYEEDPDFMLYPATVKDEFKNEVVFEGWYSDAECTMPITVLTFNCDDDIYVYANFLYFQPITWNLNGGTLSGNMPTYYTEKTQPLTLGIPTKENCRFAGWYCSYNAQTDEYTDAVTTIDFANRTEPITLYAKWQGKHNIVYHLDGGINAQDNPTEFYVGDGAFMLLPPTLNDPQRPGYVFGGWYADAAFTKQVTELTFDKEDDITVYAKWLENSISVNEVPYAWTTNRNIYVNWNNGTTKNKTITLRLPNNSTYQLEKSSSIKDMKFGNLKILGKGVAHITIKKAGTADQDITISVIECMPRCDTASLKVNKKNLQSMDYTVFASYQLNLTSSDGKFYSKADETAAFVEGLSYQQISQSGTNDTYTYKVLADNTAKMGTYTVYMRYAVSGGSIQMPSKTIFMPLKITVIGKLPKITAKVSKINAFFKDERSEGTVKFGYSENVTVDNISLVAATGKKVPTQEMLDQWYTFKKEGTTWKLCVKDGVVTDTTVLSMLPKKARFCIETQEYGIVYSGNVTIPVTISAPKLVASKSKFAMTQYAGACLSDSFLVSEKVGTKTEPIHLANAYVTNVTRNTEVPMVTCSGSKVIFHILNALNYVKVKKVKVYVQDDNWIKPVAVPISIQTSQAKPIGKLNKSTLTINLSYQGISDNATLTFNHAADVSVNMPTTLEPTDKKLISKAPVVTIINNSEDTGINGYTIIADRTDKTATGTYKYKFTPTIQKDSETVPLKVISFTVKVKRDTKPADVSLALQKGSKLEVTDVGTYCYSWKPRLLNVKGMIADVSLNKISEDFTLITHKQTDMQGTSIKSFDIRLKHAIAAGTYILPLRMSILRIDGTYCFVNKNIKVKVTEQTAKVSFSKTVETLYKSVYNQEKRIIIVPASNPGATLSRLEVQIPSNAAGIAVQCEKSNRTLTARIANLDKLAVNKTYKIKVTYQFEGGKKIYKKTVSIKIKE